uniref:Uncharacterized protein n=1 Tax=Anguilla anguilla TaxID=7936 RepID=A0A0E9PEW2_ANGAN
MSFWWGRGLCCLWCRGLASFWCQCF